jgi:hypothetical protein
LTTPSFSIKLFSPQPIQPPQLKGESIMATKVTVKRADLIKAIKAKASANQTAWDEAQKNRPPQSSLRQALLDAIN